VLVRPDQFVSWVGHEPAVTTEEVRKVLRLARGDAGVHTAS
jgi:hypothetical protein